MTDDRREADRNDATALARSAPAEPSAAESDAAADAASESARQPQPPPQPTPPRTGRGLAWLALLLALAAAGLGGYLYYRLLYQAPLASLETRLDARLAAQQQALDAQQQALEDQAAALRDSLRTELTAEFDAQLARVRSANEDALAAAEAAMAEALRFEARSRAPAERLWGLAEIDYLLRTAADRRQLARDLPVAAALLRRADQALAALDDDAFAGVRDALAAELDRLEAYRPVDTQALYLELETLQERLMDLPLAMPATGFTRLPPAPERSADAGPPGFWQQLRAELEGLVTVRKLERQPVPLLPPQDVVYLGLNLRLQLERAQLALLRGEELIYRESLLSARQWLLDYALAAPAELMPVADALARLADQPLSRPPPPAVDLLGAFRDARSDDA